MWFIYYPDIAPLKGLPFYTVSVGMHIWQYPTDRPEGYEYPQFLYSSRGQGILTTEGQTLTIPEHSVIFLPAHVPHKYEAVTDIWDVRWFVPAGAGAYSLLDSFGFSHFIHYPIMSLSSLDEILNKIHMAFQINTPDSIFFSAGYTYEFIFELYRQYRQCTNTTASQYRRRLTPLIEYIEQHSSEPITQKMMCEKINVSPQHLCRMFSQCFSTRPMEYLARTRIRHACDLLIGSSHSIEEISYRSGFNNVNYFCKTFKKYTSMTPGQYRAAHSIYSKENQ